MTQAKESHLIRANQAIREGNIEDAIELYKLVLSTAEGPLVKFIRFNLAFAVRRDSQNKKIKETSSIEYLKQRINLINEIDVVSSGFDTEFYLQNNKDILDSGLDPVEHFCSHGWREDRDPNPEFSTLEYLRANPDVSHGDVNPFLHWILYGKSEGRSVRVTTFPKAYVPYTKIGIFREKTQYKSIDEPVDIIVPIYNAFEDLVECLERLKRYTPTIHNIYLINDASTDPRIEVLCAQFVKERSNSITFTQQSNKGFISTVNLGFSRASGHVVLINTDAYVPENWLNRILLPILYDDSIATVTPMTNNGEIANIPVICKAELLVSGVADQVDLIAQQFDPLESLSEVPTGVGFCMAISRDWLDKVKSFDTSFGRGYGEEVDWCQRVRNLGGKHVLTGALFVEHRGGMSFGSEKQARIDANNQIISQRYPTYDSDVQRFLENDTAIGPRLALGLAMIGLEGEVPVFLAHRLGGGAEIWLDRLIRERMSNHKSSVVVRSGDSQETALLELHTVSGITRGNVDRSEIQYYIGVLPKKELIYSCLVGSEDPLQLIDILVKNLKAVDRLKILFHDYYPICPSYTLIGRDKEYCGIPNPAECEACFKEINANTGNLATTNAIWRSKWLVWLTRADIIEVFSQSSLNLILKVWPTLINKVEVKPHKVYLLPRAVEVPDNDTPVLLRKEAISDSDTPVVGILGSIGYQKGAAIIKELAEVGYERLIIIIIGEIDPLYNSDRLQVHGKYNPNMIIELAEKYSINRWFIPSIWPETFSFTTHECLATGLPVFAFDIGGQADALRYHHQGRLVPIKTSTKDLITILCE
jgi:GT2 family glycosyltransferase/glycosyltransferase involved in cell wall biosynthesis